MNTCLLIDDEPASRVVLRELLSRFCPDIQVVGECGDVDNAEIEIRNLKPDLIFLDIQMPGKDGFELLRRFPTQDFSVIFITSYDQYAIKAIRFNALDYLLKPVDIEELIKAVLRFQQNPKLQIIPEITQNTLYFNRMDPKLVFHLRDKVILISLNEITYFEAVVNYTKAYLSDGKMYLQARTLSETESIISEHLEFLRIHKSVVINSHFIKSYTKGDPCIITLVTGQEFEISRRRKTEILHKLSTLQLRHVV